MDLIHDIAGPVLFQQTAAMRKRFPALAGLGLLAAGAHAAPPPELLGGWRMTAAQKADKVLPDTVIARMLMVIGPDSFSVGDEVGHVDAVPGEKGKAWLTRTQGAQTGSRSPILFGFDGDDLVMATGQDGNWPTSLKPTGKPGNMVARFRKQF